MWESFQDDIAKYVVALASSDDGPFESANFKRLKLYTGSNEESSKYAYENILSELLIFHDFPGGSVAPSPNFSASSVKAYIANISPNSIFVPVSDTVDDDFDSTKFVPDWSLKLGPRHSLLVEYKRTSFFRPSLDDALLDLTSAYADYSQNGENAGRRSKVLAEAVRQTYKYMSKLCVGYAVISFADATYLVRRMDGADLRYQDCMEISQGYAWTSKDPALLEALSYIISTAVGDKRTFAFKKMVSS